MSEQAYIEELQAQAKSLSETSLGQQSTAPSSEGVTVPLSMLTKKQDINAAPGTTPVTNTDTGSNNADQTDDIPEVTVNGVHIDQDAIGQELQFHHADNPKQAMFLAAQALVLRELLHQQYLRTLGSEAAWIDDEETAITALLEHNIDVAMPNEQECKRYFELQSDTFVTAPLMQVRHILLAAHPEDGEERLRIRSTANQLIQALRERPEDFATMAQKHSACPSKDQGGELGQIDQGSTVPEFEKALFALDIKGLHGAPIESRYGWHIVYVDEISHGKPLGYQDVKPTILQILSNHDFNQKLLDYLFVLVDAADIAGITLNLEQVNVYRGE